MDKIICQICKREFQSLYALNMHLRLSHKELQVEDYYDTYILDESNLCICGEKRKFININKGYAPSCGSLSCAGKNRYQRERNNGTREERNKIAVLKGKQTRFKNHGDANFNNREKAKDTCLEKYGETSFTKTPEYIDKVTQTCQNKYGTDHHLKSPQVIEKRKETVLKEYGVDNVRKSEKIKQKIKNTWKQNYPEGNPNRNKEVRDKIEETTFKNHGVRQYLSLNPGQDKARRTALNNNLRVIIERLKDNYYPLFNQEDYQGTAFIYKWKCIKCGNEFEDYIYNSHPRCPICFPGKFGGSSFAEREVNYFIEDYISTLTNKRFPIENSNKKFEIDIFIPSLNIGIEYNGIKWHAENFGNKGKDFHVRKTNECEKQGIQLIHIFEHEWEDKQELVKSILLSKIGKNEYKIQGRKCDIKIVNSKEASEFLIDNHIQGDIKASIRIGLYYNDELVSIMTLGKSRYNKKYDYELLRYCNKLNTTVIGGFSKLLKYFKKNYTGSLISYADRRFSNGAIYEKNGFKLLHISPPNYFYIGPKGTIHNRVQFQKHKLKNILDNFDENLTEWENMRNNKYDRFWDCGNLVYVLD